MSSRGRPRIAGAAKVAGLAAVLVLVAVGCSKEQSRAIAPSPSASTGTVLDSGVEPPGSTVTEPEPPPDVTPSPRRGDREQPRSVLDDLVVVATVPNAVTMNVATNGVDPPVVAWITPGEVGVANVDIAGRSLGDTQLVNGDIEPLGHPIERPGLVVRPNGTVDLAFTSFQGSAVSVFYTRFEGGTWRPPEAISGEPRPETNLVHIGVSDMGDVALAWLEESTLSVARLEDGEPTEFELVDDLTCDCCNPAPTFIGDSLVVPYRNLEVIDGEAVRDTWAVRATDGNGSFSEPVQIADEHWFLDACPFSGPHAVPVGESLVVAFMDARQSDHPDQTSTSIWVDVSHDAGLSFGTDVEVTGEGINRWPVMAVDDRQVIHLLWEVPGAGGGLAYAISQDVGASFSEPVMILQNADMPGVATSPSVAYHDGTLIVTWTDREGGRVGLIDLG